MKTYTDTQLLRMFPVLLPEEIMQFTNGEIWWIYNGSPHLPVKPTEYLDLCRRIEEKMTPAQKIQYTERLAAVLNIIDWGYYPGDEVPAWDEISNLVFLNWQNRLIAACEVLGKEITEV